MSENDRYLWDGTGPVDEDVLRLERLLAPLALPADARPPVETRRGFAAWLPFAAAASLLAAGLVSVATREAPEAIDRATTVTADGREVPAGAWIRTEEDAREIVLRDAGAVTLDPRSRLQVRRAAADGTRFYLERGSLEARIGAGVRPRFFQVDTQAARCVDLGCRYTLSVDAEGVSRVRVTTGQVSFEAGSREVYVPRGAVCVARPSRGPGTPRFEDASPALAAAVDAWDAASAAERRGAAARLLAEVRTSRDALAAWHLMEDGDAEIARAAEAALVAVAGRPEGVPAHAGPPTADDRARWKAHLDPSWW